jgi:ribonuclease VapC
MFIDASALVAMLAGGPDADEIALKLKGVKASMTSPLSRYEAVIAIARIRNIDIDQSALIMNRFLNHYGIRTASVTEDIGSAAIIAFERYGKGRHRAALNLGDCFSYAFARLHQVPLLCKGNDFPKTDATIA